MSVSGFTTLSEFCSDKANPSNYTTGVANPDSHGVYFHGSNGYKMFRGGDNCDYVPIHRLVAVAEYGVDEVKEKHIHHKNGVKWDNRPENLEPLSNSEHQRLESNNVPLNERLNRSTDEHVKSALKKAGYKDAADSI